MEDQRNGVLFILAALFVLYFPIEFLRRGRASIPGSAPEWPQPGYGASDFDPTVVPGDTYDRFGEPKAFWTVVIILTLGGLGLLGTGVYWILISL